jgi:hypothetical protein
VLVPPLTLPSTLQDLLNQIAANGGALQYRVPVWGANADCLAAEDGKSKADHDWRLWVTGIYRRCDLKLSKCARCEAVEVRDVSYDFNVGGARMTLRKDELLGWYAGKRPAGRVFFGSTGSR